MSVTGSVTLQAEHHLRHPPNDHGGASVSHAALKERVNARLGRTPSAGSCEIPVLDLPNTCQGLRKSRNHAALHCDRLLSWQAALHTLGQAISKVDANERDGRLPTVQAFLHTRIRVMTARFGIRERGQ